MKRTRKKKKTINKLILILCLIIAIAIIIILIPKKQKNANNKLIGEWTTDGVTKYKFEENNKGYLIVPLSKYKFNYKIEKNKLYIDFENKKSTDYDYTYSIKNKKLVLKGINGEFVFKKVEKKEDKK